MKRFFSIFFVAVFLGSLFAIYVFSGINKTYAKQVSSITLFQIGVYSVYDNALNMKKAYPSSIILNEDGFYKVFIAISDNKKITSKYEDYLSNHKINYYKKNIEIEEKCLKELSIYDKLILRSNIDNVFFDINNKLLKIYEEYCYD